MIIFLLDLNPNKTTLKLKIYHAVIKISLKKLINYLEFIFIEKIKIK